MVPPGFHQLDGGSIVCLYEPIPKVVDGYEQDKQHKNTFHPLWEPCIHRTQKPWRCPQGNLRILSSCALDDTITNYPKCSSCLLQESPEVEE